MRRSVKLDALRARTQQDRRGFSVGDVVELPGGQLGIVKGRGARDDAASVEVIPGKSAALDKAIRRFSRFTGHKPGAAVSMDAPALKVGLVIGELDAVEYTTVRDGEVERYRHSFKKKSRPLLVSNFDGTALYILGGGYQFTERGIVDK